MTAKRDGKSKPKKARPKVKKATLRDLEPKRSEAIRAGARGEHFPETKI